MVFIVNFNQKPILYQRQMQKNNIKSENKNNIK